MKKIYLLILLIALWVRNSPPTFLITLAEISQKKCTQWVIAPTKYQDILTAVICGKDQLSTINSEIFRKTQLIHILVVSGSHLIFLDLFLRKLKIPFGARWFGILFMTFLTGLNPPCSRALLNLTFSGIFKKTKTYIPQNDTCLLAGLFTLLIFPSWWNSRSLILSWLASLGLNFGFLLKKQKLKIILLYSQFIIYLIMTLPLIGISSHHPLGLLMNLIFAPLLNITLLPFSFLTAFFHFLGPLYDQFLNLFLKCISFFSEPIPLGTTAQTISCPVLWYFIFLLHFLIYFLRTSYFQKELLKYFNPTSKTTNTNSQI